MPRGFIGHSKHERLYELLAEMPITTPDGLWTVLILTADQQRHLGGIRSEISIKARRGDFGAGVYIKTSVENAPDGMRLWVQKRSEQKVF